MGDSTSSRSEEVLSPIRVLIAEDEAHLGTILEQYLSARAFAVTVARTGRVALELLRSQAFDVALLDVVMPEMDGLEVLRLVREEPLPPEVIVITGNGTIETAMAALKLGAYDILSKPYRMAEIDALVRRAWEKRMLIHANRALRRQLLLAQPTPTLVTQFAPLMAVLSLIGRVAPGLSPVLLQGEVGTGKRLLARVVHAQSGRSNGPFVEIDCRRYPTPARAARELFGDSGSATDEPHLGLLELAAGGTLYLNNLDALPNAVQQLLAHVLHAGVIPQAPNDTGLTVNARIVASTSRDMSHLVTAGEFREDLLHAVSAIRVFLPPLRERVTDITRLALHFAERRGVAPPSATPLTVSHDALAALEHYRWPGNVSELRLVIERAALIAVGGTLTAQDLRFPMESAPTINAELSALPTLNDVERRHVANVLEQTQWHQGRAADILGISPKTLYRKIREFGLKRPSGRS